MSARIKNIRIEGKTYGYTDALHPRLSYEIEGDSDYVAQSAYQVKVGDWDSGKVNCDKQPYVFIAMELKPLTHYEGVLTVWDNHGERAEELFSFDSGRMEPDWQPSWITDSRVRYQKKTSPVPICLRKELCLDPDAVRILISSVALGNYYLLANGRRVGTDLLAPGYTSYTHEMQYQIYDLTEYVKDDQLELIAVVSGGWAAGVFGTGMNSGVFSKRQLFGAEVRIEYFDGRLETITTDSSWQAAVDCPYMLAGIYEGVDYDASRSFQDCDWMPAECTAWDYQPVMECTYGVLPHVIREFQPVEHHPSALGGTIYDFGQNCAGRIWIHIRDAQRGQKIHIQHAELLDDGELLTANLSRARAEVHYICKAGVQDFTPELTYFGFRYVRIEGIEPEKLDARLQAISSVEPEGFFHCSDERLNRLQLNAQWSGLSNFVDIPTDCPQRDERMGWTGDIALFASTAVFNFDAHRMLDKWLRDVLAEQGKNGEIGSVVPAGKSPGTGGCAPAWSDAGTLVPWAVYMQYADLELLKRQYPGMKKLVCAQLRTMSRLSFRKGRYLWNPLNILGDWLAPGGTMLTWGKMGQAIGSAFSYHTVHITQETAKILGDFGTAAEMDEIAHKIEDAFEACLTDGNGRLKKEYQGAYAAAICYGLLKDKRQIMGDHLDRMVRENGYRVGSGFMGAPYLLFALSDTGHTETAYRMLFNEQCPGWLYPLTVGATTTWECWDGVLPNGKINLNNGRPKFGKKPPKDGVYNPQDRTLPNLSSLNHYAYGAVCDWLYRRVCGLEAQEPGYRHFQVKPLIDSRFLSSAECATETPYGQIRTCWAIRGNEVQVSVVVPAGTSCSLIMPDSSIQQLKHGTHTRSCIFTKVEHV